jgi:hypothetical protein
MPYIPLEDRKKFEDSLNKIVLEIESKGELTYCLYHLMIYAFENGVIGTGSYGYDTLSDICGAGQDATNEFRRRRLDPHEDKKIKENGDI